MRVAPARLDKASSAAGETIRDLAAVELDARLIAGDTAPVAVAFSGGGDSLALLLLAKAWADRRGRRLLALTVDHRLRPEGAEWALWCARRAAELGVEHRALVWAGERPRTGTGVAAAARRARHALLADAARAAGAGVILLGHTADDRAESRLMRRAGSSVTSPRPWSPSPVWPAGRDIFLLRPLLMARRAELRAFLLALGERWIDDPANEDPASARARARRRLAEARDDDEDGGGEDDPPLDVPEPSSSMATLDGVTVGAAGDLLLPREALLARPDRGAFLGAALLCAAGGDRPPRREALARLMDRFRLGGPFVATLAGARLESDGARVHIVRDAADRRGRAPPETALPAGEAVVWDGRFEIRATVAGARVGLLAGHAARLPLPARRALSSTLAAARPATPLVTHADGRLECPTLAPSLARAPSITARPLAPGRLAAAHGMIVNEETARRMAKPAPAP